MTWHGIGISAFTVFTLFNVAPTCYNVHIMKPGPKPFSEKMCPNCGLVKPRADFYKKGTSVTAMCKPCSLADNKLREPKYRNKYLERQNEWRKNRYATDPDYRERIQQQKKALYDLRKDALNAARRYRWATDPFDPARLTYRRKDVKHRTPPWVSKSDLAAIYANCPEGMEVDHIIPLKGLIDGRPVSGLHVPWNLQYLTKLQNRKKNNRISESDL